VNAAAQRLLETHLWRDEQVLWEGQPLAAGPVAAHAARHGFFRALGTAIGMTVVGTVVLVKLSYEFGSGLLKWGAIIGAPGLAAFVGWRAMRDWRRGRGLAATTVYAVTNRRVLVVQGDDEHWVGVREIAGVHLRDGDIIVRRSLTDAEHRWRASANLEDEVADSLEVGTREVVLAAVPEPARLAQLLQTLQHPTAS
jgi:hypothetical protein